MGHSNGTGLNSVFRAGITWRLASHVASYVLLCFSFSDCMTLWVNLNKCRCSIGPGENKQTSPMHEYYVEPHWSSSIGGSGTEEVVLSSWISQVIYVYEQLICWCSLQDSWLCKNKVLWGMRSARVSALWEAESSVAASSMVMPLCLGSSWTGVQSRWSESTWVTATFRLEIVSSQVHVEHLPSLCTLPVLTFLEEQGEGEKDSEM